MIIVKLAGGLGNQMFQYTLGRRLALERNVPLKLDLSWFPAQSKRQYQLDGWQIQAEIATVDEVQRVTGANLGGPMGWLFKRWQRRRPYYTRRTLREPSPAFDANALKVGKHVYITGYWQSEKYFNTITSHLRQDFIPSQPLSAEAESWIETIRSSPAISLHVRRGDYVSEAKAAKVHGVCNLNYYQRAVQHILLLEPGAKFYVFSDEIAWVEHNLRLPGSMKFISLSSDAKDIEEMLLMSRCRHHILANSSYSWWGAWLNASTTKTVIAPRQWFLDPASTPVDIIPEGWMRI